MVIMFSVDVDGLRTTEEGLFKLKSSTAKSVTRRGIKHALEPMRALAQNYAKRTRRTGELEESITISSKVHRSHTKSKINDLEMYMGPYGGAKSIVREFGSLTQSATPYMRPAWDAEALPTLKRFSTYMGDAVRKSVARHEAKIARLAKK